MPSNLAHANNNFEEINMEIQFRELCVLVAITTWTIKFGQLDLLVVLHFFCGFE